MDTSKSSFVYRIIQFCLNLDMSIRFKNKRNNDVRVFNSDQFCGILNKSHKFFLMMVLSLFIIVLMGLFVYTQKDL